MKALFNEFEPANAVAWKARLEKDLKGITFEALSVKDRNDITIHPFYTQEDTLTSNNAIIATPGWSICEQIYVKDAATANKQALDALNNGASGLCFIIKNDVNETALLEGIELPFIYSHFDIKDCPSFIEKIKSYLSAKDWDLETLDCFVGNDFITSYLSKGEWQNDFASDAGVFLSNFEYSKQIHIEATLFLNAGANSVTELASTLALTHEYLHLLNENNKIQDIKKIQISVATDTNFYEQIAKLRALRECVHLLLQAYQVNVPIHLHVETAQLYRSPFDSYSNLLRDTLAGMAGVLGGCNSLYIHPFDETLATTTDFSKRMSRNQQLIFKEESYLDKVADAAAGSYYIDQLTSQLAEKAWESFKQIETEGGLIASFKKGSLKQTFDRQAQALIMEYKEGKRILIGVNKFPNATDAPQPRSATNLNSKGIRSILLSEEII